jgi:hypothetical protein
MCAPLCAKIFAKFILLVSDKYESEEPEEMKVNNDCELIWAKRKIKASKDLSIASFYLDHSECTKGKT